MVRPIPSEVPIGEVFVLPLLLIGLLGFVGAWAVARILNRSRLSRYLWHPSLAFLAIWVLMSAILGLSVVAP